MSKVQPETAMIADRRIDLRVSKPLKDQILERADELGLTVTSYLLQLVQQDLLPSEEYQRKHERDEVVQCPN
jgi:hypothetical protein